MHESNNLNIWDFMESISGFSHFHLMSPFIWEFLCKFMFEFLFILFQILHFFFPLFSLLFSLIFVSFSLNNFHLWNIKCHFFHRLIDRLLIPIIFFIFFLIWLTNLIEPSRNNWSPQMIFSNGFLITIWRIFNGLFQIYNL